MPNLNKVMLTDSIHRRFSQYVPTGPPDACWEWLGHKDEHGYGHLARAHGKSPFRAPRLSWAFANGRYPETHEHVLHSCDNPPCVNPAHLSLGTPKDNAAQRDARGRRRTGWVPGEKNGSSKLTTEQVQQIRTLHSAGGWSWAELGRTFDVHPALIRRIVRRQAWRHV